MSRRLLDRLDAALARNPALRLRMVLPSQEFPVEEMELGTGRWMSCVRGLWESLDVLHDPDLVLLMVQAPPVDTAVMRYLFSLSGLPGDQLAARVDRHYLLQLPDASPRHLSEKLLARPHLIARIRGSVELARRNGNPLDGLSCYASSPLLAQLAKRLALALLETPPPTLQWGTKSGSRRVFAATGVRHPAGTYIAQSSLAGLADDLNALRRHHRRERWLLKVDSGFGSGHGNADLALPEGTDRVDADLLARVIVPHSDAVGEEEYLARVSRFGAVIEERLCAVAAEHARYPSGLAHIGPDATVRVLATHEQVLDAENGFSGAWFPARAEYRAQLIAITHTIATALADRGVRGHVGVDFMAESPARPPAALEINLRQTGTTHGHRHVRALVDGGWSADGRLIGGDGRELVYLTTDGIISPSYRGITTGALIARLRANPRLHFAGTRRRGAIPHLWTALEPFGKIGATFVGSSAGECLEMRDEFVSVLDCLSETARDQ